jgi:hypothetical protein
MSVLNNKDFFKNYSLLSFKLYTDTFPVVVSAIKLLQENNNNFSEHMFLYDHTIINLHNILCNLSKGYNRYYSKEKCISYTQSRDCLSTILSNLLLIVELNIISFEKIKEIYTQLEDKIKYHVGVIRKIEKKE